MTRKDAQRLARAIGIALAGNPDSRALAAAVAREFAPDAGTSAGAYFAEMERVARVTAGETGGGETGGGETGGG